MDNLKGMAWMTLAMLAFALTDMLIILIAEALPIGQILALFGIGGAGLFGIWAHIQGQHWISPVLLMRPVMIRNVAEVLATVFFVTALSLIPLSTLSSVIQANPLLVTLGAALFLGEQVGWRRWTAICAGLFGVMLILQPGTEGFDTNILFAVLAAVGLSLRDLATRLVPKSIPATLLSSYSFASVALAGGMLMPVTGGAVMPGAVIWGYVGAGVLMGMVAYFAITEAMRTGDISVVTPFRYTRLVFAFVIAVFVFDEKIAPLTLAGLGIVVATGLYSLWRETRARPD
ncbi:MAG: DMT family transporter [Rhodobacteraceae bacterium]|nr:DMT family transporter [Paracoccaceae bacterium]